MCLYWCKYTKFFKIGNNPFNLSIMIYPLTKITRYITIPALPKLQIGLNRLYTVFKLPTRFPLAQTLVQGFPCQTQQNYLLVLKIDMDLDLVSQQLLHNVKIIIHSFRDSLIQLLYQLQEIINLFQVQSEGLNSLVILIAKAVLQIFSIQVNNAVLTNTMDYKSVYQILTLCNSSLIIIKCFSCKFLFVVSLVQPNNYCILYGKY